MKKPDEASSANSASSEQSEKPSGAAANEGKKKKPGKGGGKPGGPSGPGGGPGGGNENDKTRALEPFIEDGAGEKLTTNQGLPLENDQSSLKAGPRGPSLLEDFHLREKITHFDHERIPERIVHARGSGAHGTFEPYANAAALSKAGFLQTPGKKTPVFVRFSTVAGSLGSTDLARDVRGFAVKFYTEEGNFDLVGNNIPVFFIQDAMKFPDLIHAVKPEPDHDMPQAGSAHDTFWDFVSLMPESMHMIMWAMSDRAIPRSLRMMEGFGIHTFRLIDAQGTSRFVKFHWKPKLGMHSVVWDEAQKISGKDSDFHRRDLWEAIDQGHYPEWELGVQVVEEADEGSFDFDLLDPTKLIPEELVPVQLIGKLVLDRNPDNFFAETEQIAFHPGHVVPGIDFSNDPLLQGRLFSYTDTQLSRLGGPNFAEIPINRPIAPMHNNQRDGHMRQGIKRGKATYSPNSIGGGCPMQAGALAGGYTSFAEQLSGPKTRERSEKFFDHFSQAAMFFNSQSAVEQEHMISALCFELGKLERPAIRERVVGLLGHVDDVLASKVAKGLGLPGVPKVTPPLNGSAPADAAPGSYEPKPKKAMPPSPALSMAGTRKDSIETRKIALLAADGVDAASLQAIKKALEAGGAAGKIVAARLGTLAASDGSEVPVDFSFLTASSVLFDAVYVPAGAASAAALLDGYESVDFVTEAFRHFKPIGAAGEGAEVLQSLPGVAAGNVPGVVIDAGGKGKGKDPDATQAFIDAVAAHRHWGRELKKLNP